MSRSDYIYKLKNIGGRKILAIEDMNLGNMSVTNDIENVVREIAAVEKIDPTDHLIVYSDSEGDWDGWDHKNELFVPLTEDTWFNAATKYIQLKTAAACQ